MSFSKTTMQTRNSLIIEKINNMRRHSIEFHNNYVKLSRHTESKIFNKFRLSALNKIKEVKYYLKLLQEMGEFFQDDRIIQILINMLQVCFILDLETAQLNIRINSFSHLFFAAVFLVIKVR